MLLSSRVYENHMARVPYRVNCATGTEVGCVDGRGQIDALRDVRGFPAIWSAMQAGSGACCATSLSGARLFSKLFQIARLASRNRRTFRCPRQRWLIGTPHGSYRGPQASAYTYCMFTFLFFTCSASARAESFLSQWIKLSDGDAHRCG